MLQQPWWFGTPDSYYHLSASRSLLILNQPVVTDPFFRIGSNVPDSTAGMWNTVQSVLSYLTTVDIAVLYPALTALAAAAVVMAFWLMAEEAADSRVATIMTTVYVIGAWFTDFRAFGYPNHIDIAFAFAAIALLLQVMGEPRRPFVLAAGFASFTALAVHLGSGELTLLVAGAAVVAGIVLALIGRSAEERRAAWRATGATALAGALAVVLVLPTLYPRVAALEGTTVLGEDSFVWAGTQILEGWWGRIVTPGGFDFGGPVLFFATLAISALMLVAVLRDRDRRTGALLGISLVAPLMTVIPPLSTVLLDFSSYMVARLMELLRFVPYLMAAWALGLRAWTVRRKATFAGRVLLIAALLLAIPYVVSTYIPNVGPERRGHLYSVYESQIRDMRKQFGFGGIAAIADQIDDSYPIVGGDPEDVYHLSGLADIAVVAALPTHTPVFISYPDRERRLAAMKYFVNPLAEPTHRRAMIEEFGIEYVFVWHARPYAAELLAQFEDEPALTPVVETDSITLLEVDADVLARELAEDAQ